MGVRQSLFALLTKSKHRPRQSQVIQIALIAVEVGKGPCENAS